MQSQSGVYSIIIVLLVIAMKEKIEPIIDQKHFRVTIKEEDRISKKETLTERSISPLPELKSSQNIGRSEYQDRYLNPALESVKNIKFLEETAQALIHRHKKAEGFNGTSVFIAEIGNKLIRLTLNLTEGDRQLVIKTFKKEFDDFFYRNRVKINLPQNAPADYLNTILQGINNVVKFIKSAQREIPAGTKQEFFFNSDLDANWKIDLIELIYRATPTGGVEIEELNLIQNKSTIGSEKIEAIQQIHADWIKNVWADFELVRRHHLGDAEEIKVNLDNINDIFTDLLIKRADGAAIDLEKNFFAKILPKTTPEKRKRTALIFLKSDVILKQLGEFAQLFIDDESSRLQITSLMNQIEQDLNLRTREIRNITSPRIIRSIIAVGNKIVGAREFSGAPPKTVRYS